MEANSISIYFIIIELNNYKTSFETNCSQMQTLKLSYMSPTDEHCRFEHIGAMLEHRKNTLYG